MEKNIKIAILGAVHGTSQKEMSIFDIYSEVSYKYFDKKNVFSPKNVDEFLEKYQSSHKNFTKKDMFSKMIEFDLKSVENSDFIFADISKRSTGMGMELMLAKYKKVCLFCKEGNTYSNMIEGLFPDAPVVWYVDAEDLKVKLDKIMKKILKIGTFNRKVEKAGCVFFNKDTKKVGIIYRAQQKDYTFPKGHLEQGETLRECAIRETAEETKRDVELLDTTPFASFSYVDGLADESYVEYYLGVDKGPSDNTSTDTHELVWLNLDEVEDKLTYQNLKDIWKIAYPRILEELKKDSK